MLIIGKLRNEGSATFGENLEGEGAHFDKRLAARNPLGAPVNGPIRVVL